jgi:hypothetical protein
MTYIYMYTFLSYPVVYLELLLSDKDAMVVSAVEVGLALDHSVVLPVSLVQLHTHPLPRRKHGRTNIPDNNDLIS